MLTYIFSDKIGNLPEIMFKVFLILIDHEILSHHETYKLSPTCTIQRFKTIFWRKRDPYTKVNALRP